MLQNIPNQSTSATCSDFGGLLGAISTDFERTEAISDYPYTQDGTTTGKSVSRLRKRHSSSSKWVCLFRMVPLFLVVLKGNPKEILGVP